MLIDSHSHVNFDVYRKDFKSVIDHCLVNNTWLINIGSDFKTSSKTIELTRDYGRGVYAVVGLHPIHVVDDVVESVIVDGQKTEVVTPKEEFDYNKYRDLAKSSDKVVGLGEVGLDYFYFNDNDSDSLSKKNLQKEVFKKYGRKCEVCGEENNIEIHHRQSLHKIINRFGIKNINDAFECNKLWDVDNGSVVCKFCHEKTRSHQYRNAQ